MRIQRSDDPRPKTARQFCSSLSAMSSALVSSLDTFKSAAVAAQASVLVAGQPAGTQVLSDFSFPPTVPHLGNSSCYLARLRPLSAPAPRAILSRVSLRMHGSLSRTLPQWSAAKVLPFRLGPFRQSRFRLYSPD